MHHEYAVEPRVMGSSWQTFRYLIEKFGFDKGRLIAEFPRKAWFRDVYDAASGFSPTQRTRLEILLKEARGTKVIRSGRPYDHNIGWFPNALTEHQRLPFRAIIAQENADGNAVVLVADEMDEEHALMLAPSSMSIPRDAGSISTALSTLLAYGSTILIVDPFYDPFNQRYRDALRECLRVVKAQNPAAVCEVHYRYHPDAPSPVEIEREARNIFPGVIPDGMSIRVYCWKERAGGADFHARYLLTDLGGVGVDAGFSAEGSHQTTDMHRMDTSFCQDRVAAFDRAATIYELFEPVLLITAAGQVTHA
jgi:hypothetical protein